MKHCARCGDVILNGVVVCHECAYVLAMSEKEKRILQQQNMVLNNIIDKLLKRLSAED